MGSLGRFVSLMLLALSLSPTLYGASSSWAANGTPEEVDWASIVNNINRTMVLEHLQRFTSLPNGDMPSRVSGYEGCEQAAQYIFDTFKEYGLQTSSEYYNITTPIDYGSSITVLSPDGEVLRLIEAYAFWPNIVNPSPYESAEKGDILIYGGYSDYSDLTQGARVSHSSVNGSFVLLEFNNRWYWKNAALLGAKGAVFVEPDDTLRVHAEQKSFFVPLNFPRLYVRKQDGDFLRTLLLEEGAVTVKVSCKMRWVRKPAANILGFLEGSDPDLKKQIVAVSAYYDSWSPVPRLAPGATDALNPSLLLEIARLYTQSPSVSRPKRSVLFVALSGHWEGLWGAREFVDTHFAEVGSKIRLFISLDLATDSSQLGVFHSGTTYPWIFLANLQQKYFWVRQTIFQKYQPAMEAALDKKFNTLDALIVTRPPYETPPVMFDSDAFTVACYGGGIALRTTNSVRRLQRTPLDTLDRLKLGNFWPQAEFAVAVFSALTSDVGISQYFTYAPARMAQDWGFATVVGQIASYNITSAWFDPLAIKDSIVRVTLAQGALEGIMIAAIPLVPLNSIDIAVLPDENGVVEVKGVKPFSRGMMEAYVINSSNGRVEYVEDLGVYGYNDAYTGISNAFYVYRSQTFKFLPLFRCSTIALMNLINPQTLLPPFATLTTVEGTVEVYNFISHGLQIFRSQSVYWPEILLHSEPNTPTEIVIRTGEKAVQAGFYYPLVILNNATREKPEGSGYTLNPGETIVLTPFEILENLYVFTSYRVGILHQYSTFDPKFDTFYSEAKRHVALTAQSLAERNYDKAYATVMPGWVFARLTYASSIDVILDIVLVTVFFFFLLIPFSFLLERLLGAQVGLRRLVFMTVVFMLLIVALNFFHPGFRIATNIPVLLVALSVIIVSMLVVATLIGEGQNVAKELKSQMIGLHFAEISRVSTLFMSFSVGVQNMRKRKFRTVLMLASLTMTSFALIAFTSISSLYVTRTYEQPAKTALYEGYLVRMMPWREIPEQLLLSIRGKHTNTEAIVSPRAWVYPPRQELFVAPGVAVKAFFGVTPQEANVTGLDAVVDPGGRWFDDQDLMCAIVSTTLASRIANATHAPFGLGSKLEVLGLQLTVVGLMDGSELWDGRRGFVDLDNEAMSPMDILVTAGEAGRQTTAVPHLLGADVVLIPYRLAIEGFGAQPMSIAIGEQGTQALKDAEALARTVLTDIYAAARTPEGAKVLIFRPRLGYAVTGVAFLVVPFVLSALTVLNMMLALVHERVREIGIYSSVGLAPLHISGLFFSESVLYAVISGVLGYLAGVVGVNVLNLLRLLPEGFYPNFSSSFVIMAVGLTASMTMASTIYPARVASSISTPSLERKFRLTKPSGDKWVVPLPFVYSPDEVAGLMLFVGEFFGVHNVEHVGRFTTSNIKSGRETTEKVSARMLTADIWLAPYDVGITQEALLLAEAAQESARYSLQLLLQRKTGPMTSWINSNRAFIHAVREQLLIWRTLPAEEKLRYVVRATQAEVPSSLGGERAG